MQLQHFQCPDCQRLTSKPWENTWCLHQGDFQPMPPSHPESDWTRMAYVTSVQSEPLPDVDWVVVEYRNSLDFDWTRRVVSEPMPEMKARNEALQRGRTITEPYHKHGFEAFPADVVHDDWPTEISTSNTV